MTAMCPDERLLSAVPYLRPNAKIIDVGTDHAYLPIYLVKEGYACAALAADINEGPIRSAQKNIAAAGLASKISTMQTDGLCGTEYFGADHVLIFGMGGELIAQILSRAPWVKSLGIRLILQPMTRAQILRRYLAENGFSVVGECLTHGQKYYQTIVAEYTGICEDYTEEELLLGKWNIKEKSPLFLPFLQHEIRVLLAVIEGKEKSENADTSHERELLHTLNERLEKTAHECS